MDSFLGCVEREISSASEFLKDRHINTIYFGGGTPSLYKPSSLQRLIDRAASLFDCGEVQETTVELNPDDVDENFVAMLGDTSFDRISLGVQSLDDSLLRFMNRRHDSSEAVRAVELLQRAGFSNISVDVIFGVKGFEKTLRETLRRIGEMGIQHVSAYHLSIEDGTRFALLRKRGLFDEISEQESEREFSLVHDTLQSMGFSHYEISNFATQEKYRSKHNMAYWTSLPYLGFGPGAHSYDGFRFRRWSSQSVFSYVEGVRYEQEELSDEDVTNEILLTRLRTAQGLDLARIPEKFRSAVLGSMEPFLASGKIQNVSPGHFVIPYNHYIISDHIIRSLFVG